MENHNCPVTLTANIIGGKWKPSILFFLEGGTHRFGELQKLIPGLTKKMLTQHLRDLERHEIVRRKVYAEVPPRVEYSLTRHGESLKPILTLMSAWGTRHRARYGAPVARSQKTEMLGNGAEAPVSAAPLHSPMPRLVVGGPRPRDSKASL